ncbi:hypothetical protein Tco_1325492 [Tanacetum coccineum]
MIDIYNISDEEYLEGLLANEKITNHPSGNPTSSLTSHTDLTSPEVINPLSGNPTSSLTSHTDLTSPEVINPLSGNPTPILEPVTKSSSSPHNYFLRRK